MHFWIKILKFLEIQVLNRVQSQDLKGKKVVEDLQDNEVIEDLQYDGTAEDLEANEVTDDLRLNGVTDDMQGNEVFYSFILLCCSQIILFHPINNTECFLNSSKILK